jgi:hypothetical protein
MTLSRYLALLVLSLSLAPGHLRAQGGPRRAVLDATLRQFLVARLNSDSATLRRVSVGRQPLYAAYLFDRLTPDDAQHPIVRTRPPLRVRGDTAWRTYASPLKDGRELLDYVVRFERRCGQWRIAAISAPAVAY